MTNKIGDANIVLLLLSLLLAVLCLVGAHASITQEASEIIYDDDVVVKNLKLYVEGREFFIKAMAYNPVPLGIANMTASGFMGGGLCSPKKTVFNEYKSACFGSDYFDGVTANVDRLPPGPADNKGKLKPWWQDVWLRDFPKLVDLGVNTLRIYNINFLTKKFFEMYPDEYPGVKDKSVAANHVPFLDLAHKYGLKVIMPIITDAAFLKGTPDALIDKHIDAQVQEQGGHPALLMWCIGNEMDIINDAGLRETVNAKIARIRRRTYEIHGRKIPVTSAVVDYPEKYEFMVQNLDVDVFTTNAGYRDIYMDPLWAGETITRSDGTTFVFKGWKTLSKEYNKPLFVGEIGMHQLDDERTKELPDWFNQQWKAMVNHINDGCIGACFFEYSDELNKFGKQKHMGAVVLIENSKGNQNSMQMNFWEPDLVKDKAFIYKAIREGIPGSFQKYHMNADPFKLIGRQATAIEVKVRARSSGSHSTPIAFVTVASVFISIVLMSALVRHPL